MSEQQTMIHKGGRTISIITDEDGDKTVTTTANGQTDAAAALNTAHVGQSAPVIIHHHGMPASASFSMGMILGALIVWLLQRRRRSLPDLQVADVGHGDIAALARRTATLERIITDPATRTASEIEALR